MKWNRDEVRRLLNAAIRDEPVGDSTTTSIVAFQDSHLKCEIWIHESMGAVFIAADPARPCQGLPLFEITLPCSELAPCERGGMPTGLGIYDGPPSVNTLRFTITRREDGSISLSGAWAGLTRPATGA